MNERRIVQTGIDVSRYQGKIDWARVKAGGTGFAIIKCTQGVNTVDPEFHRNMRNCAAVGLPVGAYVYSKARTAFAAAEEAERAAEECAPYHLDYPIAMDFEAAQFLAMPKKTRGAIIDAFCTRIEARGYKPMLYSSKYWLSALIPSETTRRWDVWLAQYAPRPTYSGDFTMWQRGTGKVDGIAGRVDIDICYRDYVDESPDRIVFALTSPMMQGKPVSTLQAMLNAAGYTASDGQRLNVDGKLGKRSFSAFVEFLNAHKKYIE